MMMAALRAGGMDVVYSPEREQQAQTRFNDADYRGNDGYFELTGKELSVSNFPLAYEGKAVKCLRQQVLHIPAHRYRVIYMRRDGEETRQSAQALFNRPLPADWASMVDRETARIVGILKQRRDVDVIEVPYRAVLDDPLCWFEHIAGAGWPIDADEAALVVQPDKCRYRREELQAGA